jgi:hypothetical protein
METSNAASNVNADKSAKVPVWNNLLAWIEQSGGHVHRDLQLREVVPKEGQQREEVEHRGVFCSATTVGIKKGECLIRLPAELSVNGKWLPSQYQYKPSPGTKSAATADSIRTVSPWLRCLAAYYQTQDEAQIKVSDLSNWKCYIASLPEHYETLWEWTSDEMESYLAGTSVAASTTGGSNDDDDHNNSKEKELAVLLQRYREHIRPYLLHCDCGDDHNADTDTVSDDELQRFQTACQCLSTRGFNLTLSEEDHDADTDADASTSSYNGPFLLPWIDLLNHCSRSSSANNKTNTKCTTLRRLPDDTFVMMAERDIVPGEEILHSYGDHLTASQCLQTFGFVPDTAVEQALSSSSQLQNTSIPVTQAVLSKMAVLEACWSVMESNMPEQLAASMREQEMEDDVWAVSVDRSRTASFISDNLIISIDSEDDILTDELVTLACLPFLPVCAYREAGRNFLDASILDDYYLGKMVCTSLLKAVQSKLETYSPVRRIMNGNGNGNNGSNVGGEPVADDRELLRQVVQEEQASPNISTRRLMYALVVRLEEKSCLEALRRKVIGILARLDEEAEDFTTNAERGRGGEEEANSKRPRTSNE